MRAPLLCLPARLPALPAHSGSCSGCRSESCATDDGKRPGLHLQQLLAFRTQFIVAGPGLVPWAYDEPFLAGMADYLGPDSGVSNLTVRNWAQVNLANFPVGAPAPASDCMPCRQGWALRHSAAMLWEAARALCCWLLHPAPCGKIPIHSSSMDANGALWPRERCSVWSCWMRLPPRRGRGNHLRGAATACRRCRCC